jgi:PhzF family phenazine biosynthesis protein
MCCSIYTFFQKMSRKFFIIDAFTPTIGKGNPAAVVILQSSDQPSDLQLQKIATEFNLSETVFVVPKEAEGTFGIRWFTPVKEVQLCGHATLAASHALKTVAPALTSILFESHIAGKLPVYIYGSHYELHFPCREPSSLGVNEFSTKLGNCFGVSRERILDVAFHKGSQKYLLVLASEEDVKTAAPNFSQLRDIEFPHAPLSVTITAKSNHSSFDVTSRHFAPWVGIDEDPVTGAAHVVLVPYWLNAEFKAADELRCFQAYPGRGGELLCKLVDSSTVSLRGEAATFAEGSLSWLV